MTDEHPSSPVQWGLETIGLEIDALVALREALATGELGANFARAAGLIHSIRGHVVIGGMGKSGLVARKIAATLASSGTPAMFIHPADAGHGDLGMITADDVVLLLSWSGETPELSTIVTYCRRFSIPIVGVTAGKGSALSVQSDLVLALPPVVEACPNQLAPTCSTTMQVALGDALAVALIRMRGFSADDFSVFHPSGTLSARLLKVENIMSCGATVPVIGADATLLDAILEMSRTRFGATAITDQDGRLLGAFTDGDLRRSIGRTDLNAGVAGFMSTTPHSVTPSLLASEAVALMNQHAITQLFVCDDARLVGILHLHDVLRAGVA